jgi:hypothetical protein
MLFAMATILMIQLQSFQRLFLVVAVAPLGLIGVVGFLPSGAPLGFVAILGVLALICILIRNSVILIVQIKHLRSEGRPAWDAVIEATEESEMAKATPSTLYLYVPNVDSVYKQAVKAAGKKIMEPTDMFYGDRSGGVKDPSGNSWMIAVRFDENSAIAAATIFMLRSLLPKVGR